VGGRALGVLLRAYLNLTRQISVRSGKALLAERMEGKAPDPAVSSPTQWIMRSAHCIVRKENRPKGLFR